MRPVRIGVLGLVTMLVTACSSSTNGTAVATGTGSTGNPGGRTGAASPEAAVQALIDGVKENDQAKIDATVCPKWPSLSGSGKFVLDRELDPPAQRAFPRSVAGQAKQDGDIWKVPVSMPGDSPITVTAVREGKAYLACGFDFTGG
jgi:hypothetical protein